MKVYKATDKDMKCREFQYELGKAAEVKGDIELCERGLHACEMPCDFDNAINKADAENKNHATGLRGAASATGESGVAFATGTRGAASATGTRGAASATGESGVAFATGLRGAASATGTRGAASAIGKGCVAMTTGFSGRVMGEIGNAIVCVERKENGEIAAILSAVVDGKTLKPGVWYTVKNGRWQEVE